MRGQNWWSEVRVRVPVFVDEGVEGHAVSPAGGKVMDVDVGIPGKREKKTY